MNRLPFIDWVRGFAVIAMVMWHTGDGWLLPGLRSGQGWSALRFVGGLAAPSFLFLAGCAAALAARPQPSPDRALRTFRANLGRGLEVVLVGYMLRLQTWMIDAGAVLHLGTLRAWLPLALGYAALVWSVKQLGDAPRKAGWWSLLGFALCTGALVQVESLAPGRLGRLLQVDVLQAIGMSLVLLCVAERGFGLLQKPWVLFLLGLVVVCCTELMWRNMPGPLPVPIAAYFGRFESPKGMPPAALFPLFPWFSYACFGAAIGCLLRVHKHATERLTVLLAVSGAVLALIFSEAHPYLHRMTAAQPWSLHPLRVAFRAGMVMSLFLVGWLLTYGARGRLMLDYGTSSLRIYWAHMLVAYGTLGDAWHKRLHYTEWATRVVLLLAVMWLLTQIGSTKPKPSAVTVPSVRT